LFMVLGADIFLFGQGHHLPSFPYLRHPRIV
jgi:hypothetical protein